MKKALIEYTIKKISIRPKTGITRTPLLCPKRNVFTATANPSGCSVPRYTKALPPLTTSVMLSRSTLSPRSIQYREARLARSRSVSIVSALLYIHIRSTAMPGFRRNTRCQREDGHLTKPPDSFDPAPQRSLIGRLLDQSLICGFEGMKHEKQVMSPSSLHVI